MFCACHDFHNCPTAAVLGTYGRTANTFISHRFQPNPKSSSRHYHTLHGTAKVLIAWTQNNTTKKKLDKHAQFSNWNEKQKRSSRPISKKLRAAGMSLSPHWNDAFTLISHCPILAMKWGFTAMSPAAAYQNARWIYYSRITKWSDFLSI